jgi:WD40 repeat protein
VSRWRLDGGGLIAEPVARDHVAAGGYDPSGETLVVAPRGPTLGRAPTEFDLWDPEDDERLGSLSDVIGLRWAGHDALSGLSLGDGEVRFFDAASQEVLDGVAIPTPADITGATRAADLPPWADGRWPSAGGTRMYVGLPTGEVWPVDVESRQRIEPTIQVDGWPWSVSATRDGERVVVTALSPSGNVTTVHDGRTGDRIGDRLVGPAVTSVSLDGVLVGAEGGDITRYDLETLEPVATLPGARGDVSSLQFSSDGRVLLATSSDQTASLYDVATGTRLGDPLPTGAPAIVPGWLRPDGGAVALTTRDGVAIWDIEPAHLAEAACRLAGRNLTETEWETYLADLGDHRASCPEHQDPS